MEKQHQQWSMAKDADKTYCFEEMLPEVLLNVHLMEYIKTHTRSNDINSE